MPLSFIPRRRIRALIALTVPLLGASCQSDSGGSGGAASALTKPDKSAIATPAPDSFKVAFETSTDAPACHECGSIMVRSAACYKCMNCGATSGCS